MKHIEKDTYDILVEKIAALLLSNGFTLDKNFEKNSYNNQKYIEEIVGNLSYSELHKYKILIEDILKIKERKVSTDLFEEFSIVFTGLREKGYETKYLEKILKNFSEEDYSESIVNAGRALESISKSVLVNEGDKDSFNVLLHKLVKDAKITKAELEELEKIRDSRNDSAHGEEIFIEVSKESAEECIFSTFEMMKNILSRA
jgi:HEPN domain-containing protein